MHYGEQQRKKKYKRRELGVRETNKERHRAENKNKV
jgi:hypothetical protein